MDKKKKKTINKSFPEGGISAEMMNRINEIYVSRFFEEDDADDLMSVLVPFSEGKVLEFVGQMKKARETFKNILKKDPKNRWAKEALRQLEMTLH